jgi:hypothetical protein
MKFQCIVLLLVALPIGCVGQRDGDDKVPYVPEEYDKDTGTSIKEPCCDGTDSGTGAEIELECVGDWEFISDYAPHAVNNIDFVSSDRILVNDCHEYLLLSDQGATLESADLPTMKNSSGSCLESKITDDTLFFSGWGGEVYTGAVDNWQEIRENHSTTYTKVNHIEAFGTDLYAVGDWATRYASPLMRYRNGEWTEVGGVLEGYHFRSLFKLEDGSLVAVRDTGNHWPHVATFDGVEWKLLPLTDFGGDPLDISAVWGQNLSDFWVVGDDFAHYTGEDFFWKIGNSPFSEFGTYGVAIWGSSNDAIWVVGAKTVYGTDPPYVESFMMKYDGTSFVEDTYEPSSLGDVSFWGSSATDAYLMPDFAHYDGDNWNDIGNGSRSAVVGNAQDDVYIGYQLQCGIGHFDGIEWDCLDYMGAVDLALADDGTLYVQSEKGEIVRYDGTAFERIRAKDCSELRRLDVDESGAIWGLCAEGQMIRYEDSQWALVVELYDYRLSDFCFAGDTLYASMYNAILTYRNDEVTIEEAPIDHQPEFELQCNSNSVVFAERDGVEDFYVLTSYSDGELRTVTSFPFSKPWIRNLRVNDSEEIAVLHKHEDVWKVSLWDGNTWQFVETPHEPLAVEITDDGVLYAAGYEGYSWVARSPCN